MKRMLLFSLALALTLGLSAGCGASPAPGGGGSENPVTQSTQEPEAPASSQAQGEPEPADLPPLVMVDGQLYQDTGRESTLTGRCGVLDGEISSAVSSQEVPSENGQSNFGTGFGYQIGPEPGTIEVYCNGKWMVFEAVDQP